MLSYDKTRVLELIDRAKENVVAGFTLSAKEDLAEAMNHVNRMVGLKYRAVNTGDNFSLATNEHRKGA